MRGWVVVGRGLIVGWGGVGSWEVLGARVQAGVYGWVHLHGSVVVGDGHALEWQAVVEFVAWGGGRGVSCECLLVSAGDRCAG